MAKKKTKTELLEREISDIIADGVRKIYLPEIKKRTPKKTGTTAEDWGVLLMGNKVYLANYKFGHIVEFLNDGTKPHTIKPKNAQALKFEIGGKTVFAKKVEHPGIEARKFVEKMLDNNNLRNMFLQYTDKKIQKLLDKM